MPQNGSKYTTNAILMINILCFKKLCPTVTPDGHNPLILFDILPIFSLATSETGCIITLIKAVYTSSLTIYQTTKTYDLWELRNFRKISKLHEIIAECSVYPK